jgi:hypothetical protein
MEVNPANLIRTERYPVGDKDHPAWQRLCAQAQTALAQHSVFVLPDFVRPVTLQQIRKEANALAPLAHHMDVVTPLYPERQEPDIRAHHPVRHARVRTSVRAVSYAKIPRDSALRVLYEWDPLLEFIAALLGRPRIYRYQDVHGALNIAVMIAGDEFGWHVDQADLRGRAGRAGEPLSEDCHGAHARREFYALSGASRTAQGDPHSRTGAAPGGFAGL